MLYLKYSKFYVLYPKLYYYNINLRFCKFLGRNFKLPPKYNKISSTFFPN